MSDLLIRDVPNEVLAALDVLASRLGLSRTEYVRRRLAQDAQSARSVVTAQDLRRFSAAFADLADPDVMDAAWE